MVNSYNIYMTTLNGMLNTIVDDDYFFHSWISVICFLVPVVIFALFIKYRSQYTISFTTNEGWSFSVTDYSVKLTGSSLVDYDFITGRVKIKLPTGEEKIYNVSNVISIVGMTDKYSVISGVGEYVTKMFVKYALVNRLYGYLLDVVDYNHENKELVYLDSRSGKHYLKLGIKGFYNIDQSKIVHQTSSGGSFLTGFFVGRYLK